VRPENDALDGLDPFLGTWGTVGSEVVDSVVCVDGKVGAALALVRNGGRDAVPKVNLAGGEVDVCGVGVVGEDVAFEAEPVAIVLGVPAAALGQISGFCRFVLTTLDVIWQTTGLLTAFFGRYE
jgi:hypothetical protein